MITWENKILSLELHFVSHFKLSLSTWSFKMIAGLWISNLRILCFVFRDLHISIFTAGRCACRYKFISRFKLAVSLPRYCITEQCGSVVVLAKLIVNCGSKIALKNRSIILKLQRYKIQSFRMQNARLSSKCRPYPMGLLIFHLQNIDDKGNYTHYFCSFCISLKCFDIYCEYNC